MFLAVGLFGLLLGPNVQAVPAGEDAEAKAAKAIAATVAEGQKKAAEAILGITGKLPQEKRAPSFLSKLPQGTFVTIKSLASGKYLQCPGTERMKEFGETSNWASFTATDPKLPTAQFELLKYGGKDDVRIGFKASNGKHLQSIPSSALGQATWVVRAETNNFYKEEDSWEHWTVIEKADGTVTYLENEATGGCLNNRGPSGNGEARTHGNEQPWSPAGQIDTAKLKIEVVSHPEVQEPGVIEKLIEGTVVAIKCLDTDKYWEINNKEKNQQFPAESVKLVTATSKDKTSAAAQFRVHKHKDFVGFESISTGNFLESVPTGALGIPLPGQPTWVIRASGKVFAQDDATWTHWTITSKDGVVFIKNRATEGCVNSVKSLLGDGILRTHGLTVPAGPAAESVTARMIIDIIPMLPAGFEEEYNKVDFETIACGSRDGALEVWATGEDGLLYHYDDKSMAVDPWEAIEAKDEKGTVLKPVKAVSVSADGTMVILNNAGKAYKYDLAKKLFTALPVGDGNEKLTLEFISVGNKNNIWAVDLDTKNILQHSATGWIVRGNGIGIYVAAGVDGTVVALDEKGKASKYFGKDKSGKDKWTAMGTQSLDRVSVGDKNNIWGVDDGRLFQYGGTAWKAVMAADGKACSGIDEIAVNAVGTIFILDMDGDSYNKGEAGVTLTKDPSGKTVVKPTEKPAGKTSRIDARTSGKIDIAKAKAAKGEKKVVAKKKAATKAVVAKKPAPVKKAKVVPTKKATKATKVTVKKPAAKKAAKPAAKKGAKPAAKKGAKPAVKKGAKPAAKKTVAKKAAKPGAKVAKPAAKKGAKPAVKKGAKPAAKKGAKPAAKKTAAKKAAKPAAKVAKPEAEDAEPAAAEAEEAATE